MKVEMKFKNLDKALRAMAKSPARFRDGANRAIRKSIYKLQNTAQPITPIDTGALRGSYQSTFHNFYGDLTPDIEYAIYVHEGTRFMTSRPFLQQAIDTDQKTIEKYFEDELEMNLKDIAKDADDK